MSLKMELTRKVLRVKKTADAKKANVVSNSIYDVLEINNKSREVPNTLKKIAMRELNVTHTYIANVHCLEFKPRLKLKFYKNTPKESDLLYFYIHGGGFVGGFPEQGTYLIKALAQRFGLTTIAVDYTLSPEAIFPYSLNQIVNVYKEIIKTHNPKKIILGGESAGGNFCIALLLKLKEEKIPMPKMCFLASPFLDLTQSGESYTTCAESDVSLSKKQLEYMAYGYVFGNDITKINPELLYNPLVSTTYADLKGLPPTFISVCEDEVLYSDSVKCYQQLKEGKVRTKLVTDKNCFHAYMILGDFFEESSKATDQLEQFIKSVFKIKNYDI